MHGASSQAVYEDEIHLIVHPLHYRGHGCDNLGGATCYLILRITEGERLGVYVVRPDS